MQLKEDTPKNPTSSLILSLFCEQESADIVFEVCDQQQKSPYNPKRAKASSGTYHAHRLILKQHSTELAALCATSEGMTPVVIDGAKPSVFRHFLYYLYGGEISEDDFVKYAKDLISIAAKYGVPNLKLEAEWWYVRSTKISVDNVVENLSLAHATNCARLKEVLMDFIAEKKDEVMKT